MRMASTAAPSAPSLSPRPIHRDAAMAAASVTRTMSRARLRSGAWGGVATRPDHSGWRIAVCPSGGPPAAILEAWTGSSSSPAGRCGHRPRRRGQELRAQADGGLPAGRGPHVLAGVPRIVDVEIMAEVLGAIGATVVRGPTTGTVPVTSLVGRRPRPRGALRAGREDARLGGRARAAAGPLRLGPACRCPVATTSATGPSTSTSTACQRWGRVRDRRTATSRHGAGRAGWSATGGVRVPEPHRHRQRAHGRGPGQGDDGHRERGPEPEVSDLADFLTHMGARIRGAGTSHIEVEGVDELRPDPCPPRSSPTGWWRPPSWRRSAWPAARS